MLPCEGKVRRNHHLSPIQLAFNWKQSNFPCTFRCWTFGGGYQYAIGSSSDQPRVLDPCMHHMGFMRSAWMSARGPISVLMVDETRPPFLHVVQRRIVFVSISEYWNQPMVALEGQKS